MGGYLVEMSAIISLLTVSLFCFTFVFWLKKFENKYKYKKLKMVDQFIRRKNIEVNHFFVGSYFDLVDDAKEKNIWFFYLKQHTLHYRNIPYEDIFQVEYKLDGLTIKSIARKSQLKRDLVVGNEIRNSNEIIGDTNSPVDEKYRVKEVRLTILVDELTPFSLDFIFISSHFPIEYQNLKDADAREWYNLFKNIIERENDMVG